MAEVDRNQLNDEDPDSGPASEDAADEAESKRDSDAKAASATTADVVTLKVRRQDALEKRDTRRWERFEVSLTPGMTLLGALRAIQRTPRTQQGERVAPVAFDDGCGEEVCGACTLRVNGRVMLACSARISDISPKRKTITLEPLTKFPLVRDLVVDRSRMGEAEARLGAWVSLEGSRQAPRPRPLSSEAQRRLLAESACIDCGACLEACPQYGEHNDYVGAAAINHLHRLSSTPAGSHESGERLDRVMAPGGIADCGKASNCVEVCPTGVPLVDSLQRVARGTSKRLIFDWLLG